ncbi:thiamine pyrophosphate-dependent enzyme [Conexibacter woesei]|uniref:2-oxoisovalerate dehydrogenase subunit alpha n=1 Tax=Conexibacter woesei (strain DSM 14684 / CCUG 47730 / CIP 108061 / JCM 11494 / NBRC 100937 / ID131577) TaxID=469383 RepID=D3F7R9_CONWI|nr:thiamine pyrophosphate-dependent enzyme [Conexibacter woesei]ADB52813.1 Pyruvate dehydrogenase (acetyl-transferring) [Conexibacter woesei DSM 14684]
MDSRALIDALRWMRLARAVDERAISLQRQGRLGTFSPVTGQEAAVVGSALALDPARDWVVPQYRELPAMLRQGYPLAHFFLYLQGHPQGSAIPRDVRVLPMQIALAAQLPHAVGIAWGMRLQGENGVVMTYIGDGASSEGDFHETCNLAGVLRAPLVVVLQNNGWAISTPRSRQTAAETFASRAVGYGCAGVVVDGNDVEATREAAGEAVARARDGGGPTILEAVTYRTGPHTTADDPTRYVDPEVLAQWRERDPIEQALATLRGRRRAWSDERDAEMVASITEQIDAAWATAEATPRPTSDAMFDNVFVNEPARVTRQREQAREAAAGV